MNELLTRAWRVQRDLKALDSETALVGGLAVSLHGRVRNTIVVDLAVAAADDAIAEALVLALRSRGYRDLEHVDQTATGRLAQVRFVLPDSPSSIPELDLLFASSGIEESIVTSAIPFPIAPGREIRVARRGHLVALKVLSQAPGRETDTWDLTGLLEGLDTTEATLAREACAAIEARGFHRGKKLRTELARLLAPDAP